MTGQPLGYYTSWPLFALSHHIVVWWCAQQVYPGQRFTKYAALGDDIVICDSKVATLYRSVLDRFLVKISKLKSLESRTGCAEFRKRFIVDNMAKDLSPVSCKALLSYSHLYGLYAIKFKYPIFRYPTRVKDRTVWARAYEPLPVASKYSISYPPRSGRATNISQSPGEQQQQQPGIPSRGAEVQEKEFILLYHSLQQQ
ncbi:hypothetical protein ZIOFF_074389 (mitochondrion) [Zingiber officinale]|uniref:RNA-dependent RNA polymerase n=1 Tax=Zingiber officinale TaxID=94328 RepID=A0A8J5ET76_ZINOF|nr:hypothetical protein ZIOFF_074389 [Zingiber officinale]